MSSALILPLIRREIASRYRGSVLGLLWSLLTPLFMLAVYTFVFGFVMKARWAMPNADAGEHSTASFAVILFAGLIVFFFFSEVLSASTGLILRNRTYVKKIVFPLEILPVVTTGAALFQTGVSLAVLLMFAAFTFGGLPWTAILAPLVFIPLTAMMLGIAWVLAAIGVYFRDIGLIVPPVLTAFMFLSPIFFERTALPEAMQPFLLLNPLTLPVETLRDVALFGTMPHWLSLGIYTIVSLLVAVLGRSVFELTRRGFADVL